MARYAALIVDLDALDAAGQAALDAAVLVRRTADPEQATAIEDEVAREDQRAFGDQLPLRTALRFLNNPQLLHRNESPDGPIFRYHQRRTGTTYEAAIKMGFDQLRLLPDKADAPKTAPASSDVVKGTEA